MIIIAVIIVLCNSAHVLFMY